jgi:hypothetical protein
MTLVLTSSRNGVNPGVDGTPPSARQSGSRNATTVLFLVGVFGGSLGVGRDGGGIDSVSTISSGPGSLYGTILELLLVLVLVVLEPEATRRERPAFFSVVPAAFRTSGMFSLTLDLRVPISGYNALGSS